MNGGTPVALVTGASRGIGRGIAIALAEAGFDLAITARTLTEEQAPTGLVGSLEGTATEISSAGGHVVPLHLDLLDRDEVAQIVDAVLDRCGRLDVVVNNAIFVGPQNERRFVDVDPDELERRIFADLIAQILIAQRAAQVMLTQGGGTIINLTSGVATANPTAPVDRGGWALGYGCAKGGLHRAAGIIACELGALGIRCYNLQPGLVATERVRATPSLRHIAERGKDPSVVGAAAVWLLAQPDGTVTNGRTLEVDDIVDLLP